MAERAWIALLPDASGPPERARSLDGTVAVLRATDADTGDALGWLGGWLRPGKPDRSAVQVDPAALAATGAQARRLAVSWLLLPAERRPLYDDPAVVAATHRALADSWRCLTVSTLVADAVHLAGAVSVADRATVERRPAWWREDPFALLAGPRRLWVDGALFADTALGGPGTQRYAGAPWPGGSFAGTTAGAATSRRR